MKQVLPIICGALSLISIALVCTVLVVGGGKSPADPPVVSEGAATSTTTGDYWGSKLSQLMSENPHLATTTTTTTTTTAATTTTVRTTTTADETTTSRSWLTAYTGSVTVSSRTTTERTTTTTTVAMKTTRTLSQAEKDMVYDKVYNKMMADYHSKLREQQNREAQIKNEIASLRDQASGHYTSYMQQLEALRERYAGMLNSGTYIAAQENLEQQYKANVAPLSEKINKLEEQLAEAESALEQIQEPTEEEIQQAYLYELALYQLNTLA